MSTSSVSSSTIITVDRASLEAARQWLQKHRLEQEEDRRNGRHTADDTQNHIVTAALLRHAGNGISSSVTANDDDFPDEYSSSSEEEEEEEQIRDELRAVVDEQAAQGNRVPAPAVEQIHWFDFGLISRILLGMFLLTSSHSSISYRIMLAVISFAYYLLETGIASYLTKKLFNMDILQNRNRQEGGVTALYGVIVNAARTIPANVSVLYEFVAFFSAFVLSMFPGWEP